MTKDAAATSALAVPKGFRAGAAKAGVKTGVADRLDVGMIVSDRPCVAAGVFTTNQVIAAPCVVTRTHLERGTLRGIVANAGIANACTGQQGDRAAAEMAQLAATAVGCAPHEIGVASTGVIGWQLPMDRIAKAIGQIRPAESGFDDFSHAIMTTDTKPKIATADANVGGTTIRALGIAKGSGMIHPNMATLLALAPALKAKLIEDDLIVDGKTGVSGAGHTVDEAYLYGTIDESVRPYGVPGHRHTPEIAQQVTAIAGRAPRRTFTPHIVPMTRGLVTTSYATLRSGVTPAQVADAYRSAYAEEPFVRITSTYPATKATLGSNWCLVHPVVDEANRRLFVFCALDNLEKFSAGSAVYNSNAIKCLPESIRRKSLPL